MKRLFLSILLGFFSVSCLEDNIQPVTIPFNNTLDVINFVETNSNYINSDQNPSLINVDDVFGELNSSLILDIRQPSEFASGHIPGAINIPPVDIITYIDNTDISKYQKIIIVSKSGQKAAYVTSLLRIVGYNNIYSLNYGMGYWNEIFADVWYETKTNSRYIDNYYLLNWGSKEKLKINYTTPNLMFEDNSKSIKNKIKDRIKLLISSYENNSIISVDEFDDKFQTIPYFFGYGTRTFIMCYDHELERGVSPKDPILYNAHNTYPQPYPRFDAPVEYYIQARSRTVRPLGAFLYNGQSPEWDFRSDALLFTLPNDKEIIIYSYNGQRSAYITAYLNLLGYDAKFILFGAHSMMSKYFTSWEINGLVFKNNLDTVYYDSELSKYDFKKEKIRNYSYEVGP